MDISISGGVRSPRRKGVRGGLKLYIIHRPSRSETIQIHPVPDATHTAPLTKLPDVVTWFALQDGLVAITGNEQIITVELRRQVIIIEFLTAIDDGRLTIISLGSHKKIT